MHPAAARELPGQAARGQEVQRPGLLRAVATLAGGAALGQLFLAAAAPVAARLFTPAEFGLAGVYASLVSVIVVVACLRFEAAIALPRTDRTAAELTVLALGSATAWAIGAAAAVWLAGDSIAQWLGVPDVRPWLWLLPVSVLGGGCYQALSAWLLRAERYPAVGRTKLTQGVGGASAQLSIGWLVAGPAGLFVGDLASRNAGVIALAKQSWPGLRKSAAGLSRHSLARTAAEYGRFPLIAGPASLVNIAAAALPAPLFAAWYGAHAAGGVVLAQRITTLPVLLVGAGVAQVFTVKCARLVAEGNHRDARELFARTLQLLLPMGLALAAGGALLGPSVVPLVLGDEWREAGEFVSFASIVSGFGLVVSPISQVAYIAGRQGAQFAGDLLRTLLILGAISFAAVVSSDPLGGMAAYCGVMSLTYAGFFLFYWRTFRAITTGGN